MDELSLPVVVKPNRGGSALGIRLVERPDQLPAALMAAFGYDDTVLLEQRVVGTELALSMVDGLATLPAVEIRPKEGWYDFSARYTHGAAEFRVPAKLDPEAAAHCLVAAQAAHLALGCRDISRVDAVLTPEGTCHILEVNTGPGLTSTSLVPWPPTPPASPSATSPPPHRPRHRPPPPVTKRRPKSPWASGPALSRRKPVLPHWPAGPQARRPDPLEPGQTSRGLLRHRHSEDQRSPWRISAWGRT
jgi:hypothetical protein